MRNLNERTEKSQQYHIDWDVITGTPFLFLKRIEDQFNIKLSDFIDCEFHMDGDEDTQYLALSGIVPKTSEEIAEYDAEQEKKRSKRLSKEQRLKEKELKLLADLKAKYENNY